MKQNVSINESAELSGYGTFTGARSGPKSSPARSGYSPLAQHDLSAPGVLASPSTMPDLFDDLGPEPSYPAVPNISHVQFSRCKTLRGGCWFTHDAQMLVHGGVHDKELSLWNIRTGQRRVGLSRSDGIVTSALAPLDAACGSMVCVAALDGLAMYTMPTSDSDETCDLVWESTDAAYCDVAFSPDGKLVASAHCKTGLVQLRDAETGRVRAVVDDFPACFKRGKEHFTHALCFAQDLLLIGGRKGKRNAKQFRAVSVASLLDGPEPTYRDVSLPSVFSQIAVDGNGRSLAVVTEGSARLLLWQLKNSKGRQLGAQRHVSRPTGNTSADKASVEVLLREKDSGEAKGGWEWDTPRVFGEKQGNSSPQRWFTSVALSNDGTVICTGMHPASTYALWDARSCQCFHVIAAPGSEARVCAFSPAGDVLATGGEAEPITLHELRAQQIIEKFEIRAGDSRGKLDAGSVCSSADYIVMVSGSRLVVKSRRDGTTISDEDLGNRISGGFFPVAISPLGTQIACAHNGTDPQTVSLQDIATGRTVHTLSIPSDDWFGGVNFSPDGAYVLVFGNWGTMIFSSTTGEHTHLIRGPKFASHHSAAIDHSGQFVLTTGHSGCSAVFELETQSEMCRLDDCVEERRRTYGGCYDDAGDRLAYCMRGENQYSEGDDERNTVVVVCDAKDPRREIKRFHLKGPPFRSLQFSPGNGKYILFATRAKSGPQVMVLDSHTGEEMSWSSLLLGLMIPHAVKQVSGICWMMIPRGSTDELVLQVVAGDQAFLIDLDRFVSSYKSDGKFTVDQLTQLSIVREDAIPTLIASWPRLVNVRDPDTFDTVLHRCARATTKVNATTVKAWLSGEIRYTLVKDNNECSALHEAALRKRARCCKALIARLDPQLPLQRSLRLTEDLMIIAHLLPEHLVACVESLEQKDCYNLFRPIRDLPVLKETLTGYAVRASEKGDGKAIFDIYEVSDEQAKDTEKRLRADETKAHAKTIVSCYSQLQVMALRRFAWVPSDDETAYQYHQPYTQLITSLVGKYDKQLDALLKTKLMRVTTQHKWDNYVRARVVWELKFYVCHGLVSAFTMRTIVLVINESRQEDVLVWLLQGVLLVTNSMNARLEIQQVLGLGQTWCERLAEYFWSPDGSHIWNWLDLSGIVCLYAALFVHVLGSDSIDVVRQVGSVGVMCNILSILQAMKPVQAGVGNLILTIEKIMVDIRAFVWISGILLLGFTLSFTISVPGTFGDNKSDGDGHSGNSSQHSTYVMIEAFEGVFQGVMALFEAQLGDFETSQYTTTESQAFFFVFLVLMPVIMLNLLIAIMNDSYSTITLYEGDNQRRRLQAMTIIHEEARMSRATLRNRDWFPEYLEILEPVTPPVRKDETKTNAAANTPGPSDKKVDAMKVQIDEMSSKLEPALSQIDEMHSKLEEMSTQLAQLAA